MSQQFRLKHDFVAEHPDELSCKAGEIVNSVALPNGGWIKVRTCRKDAQVQQGLVPYGYLEIDGSKQIEQVRSASSVPATTFQSSLMATKTHPYNVAVEHAECSICYDEMTAMPCCVLLNSKMERSCRHFLHLACAQHLLEAGRKECPICRAPFVAANQIPDFDVNPKQWFECVDADRSKSLSKYEVLEVMKALMAIDYRALEKNVDALWPRWDKDNSGEIDFQELCDPKTGLLVYVRSHFARVKRSPPPELDRHNLEVWFCYWDEDGGGTLEKEEVLRALIKTFKLSSNFGTVNNLREIIGNVWMIFDSDGSGSVELGEFIARDGLGESLCASLQSLK
jgi:Ca2+-binding EF-hand superfamily protein